MGLICLIHLIGRKSLHFEKKTPLGQFGQMTSVVFSVEFFGFFLKQFLSNSAQFVLITL